jgi:hypothetical protein
MKLTKPQLFAHVHAIVKMKNVAHFGGYQKAFGHFLREAYQQQLAYGFQIVEPSRVWA